MVNFFFDQFAEKPSTEETSSSETEKPDPPKTPKSVPRKSISSESSDSESSDSDDGAKKFAPNVPAVKQNETTKPAEVSSPAAGTRTPNPETEKKTKKRKRKRQPKNKNKLPTTEANMKPEISAPEVVPSDPVPKRVGSNPVLSNRFSQSGKKSSMFNQTSKHFFFQDEPMDVAQEPGASPSAHAVAPEVPPPDQEVAAPRSFLSGHYAPAASSKPDVSMAPSPANANRSYPLPKLWLIPNSGNISCEQALLGQVITLQAVRNSPRPSNGSSSPASCQNGHQVDRKRLNSNQNNTRQVLASESDGPSLANLLNLAQAGNTLRGSRQRKPDVWSNRSVVLENTEVKTEVPTSKPGSQNSVAPRDYDKYQLLSGPPAVGSVIAFKFLHLSANYSPGKSNYPL